jgi:peptidoglycan/xylan/chitin deacetylase (PgdA/CDA1 family)
MPKAACSGLRRLRAAGATSIAACAFLLILSAAAVAQETGRNLPMCWSPEMLAARPDDHRIQSAGRSALRTAPKRTPVAGQPLDPSRRLAIRRVDLPPGVKLVALTFDLCEQPHEIAGYQGAIVDYLRAERVKATFFAGGKWMLTHRDRTQQLMADPLFEIGNHAWEHRNLRLLRGSALTSEIENTQVSYEQVREELGARQCLGFDGRRPAVQSSAARLSLFRFPFGACDDPSLAAVGEMGLKAIQWDVSSGDPWSGQTPERMTQGVLGSVKPGSIVLFHANGRGWHTSQAIRAIIPALKAKGYRFVTVTELLDSGKPVYSRTCYDSRPGDTDRYDVVAQRLNGQSVRQKAKADTGFRTEVYKQP